MTMRKDFIGSVISFFFIEIEVPPQLPLLDTLILFTGLKSSKNINLEKFYFTQRYDTYRTFTTLEILHFNFYRFLYLYKTG